MFFERGDLLRGASIHIHLVYIKTAAFLAQIIKCFVIIGKYGAAVLANKGGDLLMRAGADIINPDISGNRGYMVLTPGIFAAFFIMINNFCSILIPFGILGPRA